MQCDRCEAYLLVVEEVERTYDVKLDPKRMDQMEGDDVD